MQMALFLSMLGLVCGVVGTVVGRRRSPTANLAASPRATIGIYETIDHFLTSNSVLQWSAAAARDGNKPYQKAMDWIQNDDPLQLLATDATLIQRYLAVYFYFATSLLHPWSGSCAPSLPSTNDANQEDCIYQLLYKRHPEPTYGSSNGYKWLSSRSECDWAGVMCDEMHQIFHIDTGGMNLTGSFPEGILLLPFLAELTMSDNQLTGTLPASLSKSKFMEKIRLDNNQLVGSIPQSWYTMHNLNYIVLAVNRLVGSIGANVNQLSNLRGLWLYENEMTGTLPTTLGAAKSLKTLRLSENTFRGLIPTSLGNLHMLHELWMQRNLFTGSIPSDIGRCARLDELRLNGNRLNLTIPEELYNATTMYRVDLFDKALSGTFSTQVGRLTNLESLRIENNKLQRTLPTKLGKLKPLEELSVSGNDLTGDVPRRLCNLRSPGPPGSSKVLKFLQVDCSAELHGGDGNVGGGAAPEIACTAGCCTQCCDADGANCLTMLP